MEWGPDLLEFLVARELEILVSPRAMPNRIAVRAVSC